MEDDFDNTEEDELPQEPRAVIDYIRRIEYGVGANLSGEGALILRKVKRKYGKLLSTIANELNSEDNHFLLELIQNAQDNKYAEGLEPTIAFKATPQLLVVENNELGFSPENVKSLCSAAESTKTDKTIYIGEKGIGFKSVFKVTDAPEIHSNGFHFRFLRNHGRDSGLGYILPHWHEPTTPVRDGVTTLVLPAKADFKFEDFSQLSPTLLLFLSKLRRIDIEMSDVRTSYRRVDEPRETRLVTEVRTGDSASTSELTFVTAESTVSMADILEERRKGVRQSKLVLAFPLNESGAPSTNQENPVFAFLPVADYGLRFILHSDFVLTSSRESIQETLPWNKRLRDSLATAFLEALRKFKSHKVLRYSYFDFLPRKGDVKNEFFKVACSQVIEQLRHSECVLGEAGRWMKPADILLGSAEFRRLVPSPIVKDLFGKDYPHPDITGDDELLTELGCNKLMIDDVCSLFSEHKDWFKKQPQSWKASFFVYLARLSNQSYLIGKLKELPCLPLAGGGFARPDEQTVFFPLRAGSEYGFEHELQILHPGIFAKAAKEDEAVERLFSSLGVRRDDPYTVVHSYILPKHREPDFGGAADDTLIAHLRYVKERWDEYKAGANARGTLAASLQQLRTGLFVGTKAKDTSDGGWQFRLGSDLYLSKEYQPAFSLEEVASGEVDNELFVSERYLTEADNSSSEMLGAWRAFMGEIGVAARPRVIRTPDGGASCSPEISALLNSTTKAVRRAMLEAFDRDWGTYDEYSRLAVTLGRAYMNRPTQFVQQLRSMTAPTKRRTSFTVSEAYADTAEVRAFFGENANYIDARLSNPQFLNVCGITCRVDAQACLRRLREAKAGAKLSRDQLRHIFNRLEESWKQDHLAIEQAFKTEQLLPLTIEEKTSWFKVTEVTWRSPPSQVRVLEKLSPSLAGRYPEHGHFFTRLLRVQNDVPISRWPDALNLLTTIDDEAERQRTATAIYQKLSSELEKAEKGEGGDVSWLSRFESEKLLFTLRGSLVTNSVALFRADVPELVGHFQDIIGLDFLGVPADQLPKVSVLLDALKVRSLSESVEWRVAPGTTGAENRTLTERVRALLGPIARVVYWRFGHTRFKAAIERGLLRTLSTLTVLSVRTLEMDAVLEGHARKTTGDAVLEEGILYLREGAPAALDQVAREIRKLLELPESATDIFARLLLSTSKADADEYLRVVKHIEPLPPAEERQLQSGSVNDDDERQDAAIPYGREPAAWDDEGAEPVQIQGAGGTLPRVSLSKESSDGVEEAPGTKGPERPVETVRAPLEPQHQEFLNDPPPVERNRGEVPPREKSPPATTAEDEVRKKLVSDAGSTRTSTQHPLPSSGLSEGSPLRFDVRKSARDENSQRGKTRSRRRRAQGRMLSYAEPSTESPDSEEQRLIQQRKDAVELAAVRCALRSHVLTSRWAKLTPMERLNPGYDIEGQRQDGSIEFIEVKGKSGEWGADGVALTRTELDTAREQGDRYWLCVVENALSASPRVYLVQGPYASTDRFCFDANWKTKAVASLSSPVKPAAGLYVTIPGKGKGKILSVKGTSQMSRMHIIFDDGQQVFKLFEPDKMSLTKE